MARSKQLITPVESRAIDHIAKHGSLRGFTFGRGRPYDKRIIERLLAKGQIIPLYRNKRAAEAIQDDYCVVGPEDQNGIAVATYGLDESEVLLYGRLEPAGWDSHPDQDLVASAMNNGNDTAIECGYNPSSNPWLFARVASLFAASTMEMLLLDEARE